MENEKEVGAKGSKPVNELNVIVGVITSFTACALALFRVLIHATSMISLFVAIASILFSASLVLYIGKVANDYLGNCKVRVTALLFGYLGIVSLLFCNVFENPFLFCFGCLGIPLMVLSFSDEATELKHKTLSIACFVSFAFIALTFGLSSIVLDEVAYIVASLVFASIAVICKGSKLLRHQDDHCFVDALQSEQNDTSRPKRLTGQIEWGITIGTCFTLFLLEARAFIFDSENGEEVFVPLTFLVAGIVVVSLFFCFHTRYEKYINNYFASGFILLMILYLAVDAEERGFFTVALLLFILILATSFLDGIISENRFLGLSPIWQFGKDLSAFFLASALSVCLMGILWSFGLQILCIAILCTAVCALQSHSSTRPYPNESVDDVTDDGTADSTQCEDSINFILANYGLTQRQKEVFIMLARGRNAAYISDYYSISYSTAKTHIHNLYNKLSVHSQQEMITLIEYIDLLPLEERRQLVVRTQART